MTLTYRPKCPNHHEPLEGLPFPLEEKGTGICPVSGVPFSYQVELDDNKIVQNKDGSLQPEKGWKVEGDEE